VEHLEHTVTSLVTSQQQNLKQITELFIKLNTLSPIKKKGKLLMLRYENGKHKAETAMTHGTQHSNVPKMVKLDFTRFDGREDPTSWLCCTEQFFLVHDIPLEEQVALASFHLEGDAQLWFQLAKPEMGAISRNDFKEGLHSRYGPTQLADYFRELTKLQQTSTIKDYQTHFEKLLAKVGHLPQGRQVSCFISSLHDSIKADVLINRSTTLTQAIELARLCEAQNLF
jgi:hypothetical protein